MNYENKTFANFVVTESGFKIMLCCGGGTTKLVVVYTQKKII